MARNIFSRTVTTQIVTSVTVDLLNNTLTTNAPVNFEGNDKEDYITRVLKDKFGESTIIKEIKSEKNKYTFSLKNILPYADSVEPVETQSN